MEPQRRLFCQRGPLAYRLSVVKCRLVRRAHDALARRPFARMKSETQLPALVWAHRSPIRRRLAGVDARLQENKAVNLGLAAPRVSHVLIRPGEEFSFWQLVGCPSRRRGYREGLTILGGHTGSGIGGGMCQFSNLIHWLVLHTPLTITEHHHHDHVDLFPDSGRRVPFGTGTSIAYNYLDYRFRNPTAFTFQLIVEVRGDQLCGEIRADHLPPCRYEIREERAAYVREGGDVYRCSEVWRRGIDRRTGACLSDACLKVNHARVLYDTAGLPVRDAADTEAT